MELYDNILNFSVIILLIVITWFVLTRTKTPKNLPPGPKGIPYLGYMPFLGKDPNLTLKKLSEKYGDIMTLYIGNERVIVLSSFRLIKEIFHNQGNIYIERPDSFKSHLLFGRERGMIASTSGPLTKIRKFSLSTFRNLGMGKTIMEQKILEELSCIIDEIQKLKGQPTNFHNLLAKSVANMIVSIMFGNKLNLNDKLQQLISSSSKFILSIGLNQWSQFLPQIINNLFGIKEPRFYGAQLYDEMLAEISSYYTIDKDVDTGSYLYAWKSEARKSEANSQFYTDERLAHVLVELFIPGNDTTTKTLEFGIFYLIKYPKVQEKVQREIDSVIGKGRVPTMADQKLMPYTEATIMEINRMAAIIPLALPHCANEDTMVDGYFIPKHTTIVANLWAVFYNPEVFSEPKCFKPERFLTEDNKVIYNKELIPFSIGKRQCVGEALARMELFLYFTSLLQHFSFTTDDEVSLECRYSLVVEPLHQKIRDILR